MLRMIELFVICVTLGKLIIFINNIIFIIELFYVFVVFIVATGNSAPWSENNDLREYDLEWQCEQLCERLYGKSFYNENNSTCSCSIDEDDPGKILT